MSLKLHWSGNNPNVSYAHAGKGALVILEVKKKYKLWYWSIHKNGRKVKEGKSQTKTMAKLRAERAYFGK